MSASLAPNRIHSLPVHVTYHLPSTSQTFSTLLSAPQQVYVHANAAPSRRDGEDETWGSIYLKTVVMGVLMASPEVHPAHPSTPDLSLYVLDPRETYLRKSRAASSPFISQIRSNRTSSPIPSSDASSPPDYTNTHQPTQQVWTGKGLISWALDEPGQGKNLITGRLARAAQFTRVIREQGMSALEALMAADSMSHPDEESWGIEISIGLRSSVGGPVGIHPQVQSVMAMEGPKPDPYRRLSATSDTIRRGSRSQPPSDPSPFQRQAHPAVPRRSGIIPSVPLHASVSAPTRGGQPTPVRVSEAKSGRPSKAGRKKKDKASSRTQLSSLDANADLQRTSSQSSAPPKRPSLPPSSDAAEPFPTDLPSGLFSRPESLTQEQAQRLMASPAFLSMLSQMTGANLDIVAAAKRARDGDEAEEGLSKKPRYELSRTGSTDLNGPSASNDGHSHNGFVCWNCGRTKSAVWRTKLMEDGKSVRVCNACGLYWNKMGSMRPPTLWGDVDDDPGARPRKDKKASRIPSSSATVVPSSEPDIPAVRMDKPKAGSGSGSDGFKRTLSSVVEQDAKRLANLRTGTGTKPPIPKSSLHQSTTSKPVAATSPPRGSTSATKSLRNAKWNGDAQAGASSPGGWAARMHSSTSGGLNSIQESPNTAIRRIFTATSNNGASGSRAGASASMSDNNTNMQTLDMPLSDDGNNPKSDVGGGPVNWGTDLSAFFDVDGFSIPPQSNNDKVKVNVKGTSHRNIGISPRNEIETETRMFTKSQSQSQSRRKNGNGNGNGGNTTDPVTDEDDVLSQLFNRTSSVGIESSPNGTGNGTPFDFSQLPPSSPPMSMSNSGFSGLSCQSQDLPHSALLLSSPDDSPISYSVSARENDRENERERETPEKSQSKSKLRHSISANNNNNNNNHNEKQLFSSSTSNNSTQMMDQNSNSNTYSNPEIDMDEFHKLLSSMNHQSQSQSQSQIQGGGMYDINILNQLFASRISESDNHNHNRIGNGQGGMASSSAEAECLVGGGDNINDNDDFLNSLINGSFN